MDVITRRAVWGWVLGLVVLVAIFVAAVAARPTVPDATGGAIARVGLIAAVAALPVVMTARTVSKFTMDNTVAAVVLPVALAAFLGLLVVVFGFTPEQAKLCSAFERHGLEPDPECFTSTATRLREFAEGVAMWILFGLALMAAFRLRARKRRRPADRSVTQV